MRTQDLLPFVYFRIVWRGEHSAGWSRCEPTTTIRWAGVYLSTKECIEQLQALTESVVRWKAALSEEKREKVMNKKLGKVFTDNQMEENAPRVQLKEWSGAVSSALKVWGLFV